MKNPRLPVLASLLLAIVLVAPWVAPSATAAVPKDEAVRPALSDALGLATGGCVCARERSEMVAYRDRIAAASTPEAARELALAQTRLAHGALDRARWVMPFSRTIGKTRGKLEAYEARVRDAGTPAEVAAEFAHLTRLASADDPEVVGLASTDDPEIIDVRSNCSYTTTEIVIIVIGFLFAIIPGIIFMFLLC